jgi:hypothetical protein
MPIRVEVSALPHAVSESAPRVRVTPRLALRVLVPVAALAQVGLAWLRTTPSVFPDEFLYSQLSQSLATTGRLRVRGVSAHFLPVLEPVLTAPLWLFGVAAGYRLVQVENAVVMSLAAVPAYLIARRLLVSEWTSVGVAALAVVAPPLLFTGMLLSEPFAYPLALAVALAALASVERPTRRGQLVLLALCALATLARLQLAVLPLCVAVVVLAVGLRERRLRATLREHRIFIGLVALGLVGGLGVTLLHGLGYYHLVPALDGVGSTARVAGLDLFIVVLAAGVAVVPSAVAGLGVGLVRPRSRGEFAFGVFATTTIVALLLQCVLWGDVGHVQERYLGYVVPLLAIAFGVRRARGGRAVVELGIAAAIAVAAVLLPLSGTAIDSEYLLAPVLYAFDRVQLDLHDSATTALAVALAATLLAAVGAVCARGRRGTAVASTLSIAAAATLLAAAGSWTHGLGRDARARFLPADAAWVDHATRTPSTMVVVESAWRGMALETLFWNPRIEHVVMLPGSTKVDELAHPIATIGADGTLTFDGRPLTGPVVTEGAPLSTTVLAGATRLASFGPATAWRPREGVRLRSIFDNRLPDGRVRPVGRVRVWGDGPRLAGWVVFRVHAPAALGTGRFVVAGVRIVVPAGETRIGRVRVCGRGPWQSGFTAAPISVARNGQWISPHVAVPRYVADPTACA